MLPRERAWPSVLRSLMVDVCQQAFPQEEPAIVLTMGSIVPTDVVSTSLTTMEIQPQ